LRALQENPQAGVAYSWTDVIDDNSQFLHTGSHLTVNGNAYANLLLVNFLEHGSNPLIRRQALNEVGGFDESLNSCEDLDMYLRLAAHYHFVAVPSPQILYRVSSNSMSTNLLRMETSYLQVIKRAFAQAPESVQYLKKYSLSNIYKYLTFKALGENTLRHRSYLAIKFIWYAMINDPTLSRTRVIWKVLLKIVTVIFLPAQIAQLWINNNKGLFNISALLVHIKREIPSDNT
ncbi:MAG: glycosyl transferase family A, partial [Moorea sp. SIO2B7]|nr:glycosyl transferase family A [Moorena sp. SIO2B7]